MIWFRFDSDIIYYIFTFSIDRWIFKSLLVRVYFAYFSFMDKARILLSKICHTWSTPPAVVMIIPRLELRLRCSSNWNQLKYGWCIFFFFFIILVSKREHVTKRRFTRFDK